MSILSALKLSSCDHSWMKLLLMFVLLNSIGFCLAFNLTIYLVFGLAFGLDFCVCCLDAGVVVDKLPDKSFVTAFTLVQRLVEGGTRASGLIAEGGLIEEGETDCHGRLGFHIVRMYILWSLM